MSQKVSNIRWTTAGCIFKSRRTHPSLKRKFKCQATLVQKKKTLASHKYFNGTSFIREYFRGVNKQLPRKGVIIFLFLLNTIYNLTSWLAEVLDLWEIIFSFHGRYFGGLLGILGILKWSVLVLGIFFHWRLSSKIWVKPPLREGWGLNIENEIHFSFCLLYLAKI